MHFGDESGGAAARKSGDKIGFWMRERAERGKGGSGCGSGCFCGSAWCLGW